MQKVSFDGRIIHEDISKTYKIGKELGSGNYGSVRLIAKRTFKKKHFALKSIHRDRISSDIDMLERELDILMSIDHPNIIDFEEIYMDDFNFNFVTQLCEGDDLFANLEKEGGRFPQEIAAKIIKQILMAIKHMHDIGICHRDLKLENIMVETKKLTDDPIIKVIDFGLAKYFNTGKMDEVLGTPYYIAPEVILGSYTQSCDMWSIGVILYSMLVGYPPFNAETEQQLFKKILEGKPKFYDEDWEGISLLAKDLIYGLLQVNEQKRLTPAQALKHPWLQQKAPTDFTQVDDRVLSSLLKCKGFSTL